MQGVWITPERTLSFKALKPVQVHAGPVVTGVVVMLCGIRLEDSVCYA